MYDTVLLASMNAYIDLCATIIVITDVIMQNQHESGKRTTAVYRVHPMYGVYWSCKGH